MGKKGGTSWLTVVKRAFRSPPKDHDKKTSRRREEMEQEEEEKKREKRRWLLRRPTSNTQQCQEKEPENSAQAAVNPSLGAEQRHAIAVGAATTAAAEAAVRKTNAAVEIIRLTRLSSSVREHSAAIIIQTAFRGYLARRALRALKGIVKLQALVRGQNVRKQATMTLKCMQALLRVQARVRDQRARLSQEGSRKSMFAETTNIWDSRFLRDVHERISIHSRAGSCLADDWDEYPCTLEQLDAILQSRKEASLKREKTLAHAFYQQIWDSGRIPSTGDETEQEGRLNWFDRWMATKQWENSNRTSTDRREAVKVLEIDTSRPHCYSSSSFRRTQSQIHHQKQSSARCPASPNCRESYPQFPITPSPSKMKPLQVRSASPRCPREERSYSLANTPSMSSARCGPAVEVEAKVFCPITWRLQSRLRLGFGLRARRGRGRRPQRGNGAYPQRNDSRILLPSHVTRVLGLGGVVLAKARGVLVSRAFRRGLWG
ncbi:hypothetical protein NMG60_11026860 [Bertholletia excelsa]